MKTTTPIESTQKIMQAYGQALLSFDDYANYLAEDVTVSLMGTDKVVNGREAARQFIDFFHQQAFRTNVEIKNMVFGDNSAIAEVVFVGTHIKEFEGIAACNREVQVPYVAAYDLANEKITALRLYFPMELLLQQIGGSTH